MYLIGGSAMVLLVKTERLTPRGCQELVILQSAAQSRSPVSVVIPCYNQPCFLNLAMKRALAQVRTMIAKERLTRPV
jgi:hypothetical protein